MAKIRGIGSQWVNKTVDRTISSLTRMDVSKIDISQYDE